MGAFWVEVTLHVELRIYNGGSRTFSYTMSYSHGKPWYTIWHGSVGNHVDLYIDDQGRYTAANERTILNFLTVQKLMVEVHFDEVNMDFEWSARKWSNQVLFWQRINQLIGNWAKQSH